MRSPLRCRLSVSVCPHFSLLVGEKPDLKLIEQTIVWQSGDFHTRRNKVLTKGRKQKTLDVDGVKTTKNTRAKTVWRYMSQI